MKKNILFAILLAVTVTVYAKSVPESSVPQPVRSYVSGNFTNVRQIEWDAKKNSYAALFFVDGREINLEISPDGKLISSSETLFMNNLPASITSFVKNNYEDAEISGSKKLIKEDVVTYEIEVVEVGKGGYGKPQKLIFDREGKLIKK